MSDTASFGQQHPVYGVVTFFDSKTDARAIALSKEYRGKAKDKAFVLGLDTRYPHVSHWHGRLSPDGVEQAKARLSEIVESLTDPLSGSFRLVNSVNGGWLFWQEEPNPAHRELHGRIVPRIAPLFAGEVKFGWEDKMSDLQKRMVKEWNFPNCMESWDPHITLTVLAKRHASLPTFSAPCKYVGDSIALVRIGADGVATEVVYTANLPQPK